jgi:transposase-like protein
MEDYPKTLLEFAECFATEQACMEYLFKIRWPEGFRCPKCGGEKAWATKRGLFCCALCNFQTSVITGTIFQDTKKPLRIWFWAIWNLVSQKYGANAKGLQRVLDFGCYETAWTLLHKLRCAMVRPGRDRLSGTVQVDETYVGGEKPGKRGRGAAGKALVVIMAELKKEQIGRIRLSRVPDASGPSLERAVKEGVEPGSIIQTDGWRGYGQLSAMDYEHVIIRKEAVVGKNLLPKVNRVAALLKRWLLGTYQGRAEISHLDYYLDEYTFRFNRRTSRSRGKLFYRLLQQAVAVEPVLGKNLQHGAGTHNFPLK